MTLQKALELSIEVWVWWRDNPNLSRAEWPGWDKKKTTVAKFVDYESLTYQYRYKEKHTCCGCFLCQYQHDLHKECDGCPLLLNNSVSCAVIGHPFDSFLNASTKAEKYEHATRLITIMQEALNALQRP